MENFKSMNEIENGFDIERTYEELLEAVNGKDNAGVQSVIDGFYYEFENKIQIMKLFEVFRKFNNEAYIELLGLMENVQVYDKKVKNIIAKALLKNANHLNKFLPTLKVILNFADVKSIQIKYFDKMAKHLTKVKEDENEFVKLFEEKKRNLNYIILIGSYLKYCKNEIVRKTLQDIFISFYDNEVLVDENRDKNLAKQRLLNIYLANVDQAIVYEKIIPSCENLVLRSFQNIKFLENVFNAITFPLTDEFSKNVINKYKDFFFNDKTFDNALESFKNIIKHTNYKLVCEYLLSLNFSADKAELNINTCFYLTYLVDNVNELNSKELLSIINFITKKVEILNEANKPRFERIFEIFIVSLLKVKILDEGKENMDNHFNQMKKLITTSNYSYLFSYFYIIMSLLSDKLQVEYPKTIYESLFNLINNITFNASNIKNNIAVISTCFSFARSDDLFNAYKKNLNNALTSVNNIDIKLLTQFGRFDNICLLNVFKQISLNGSLKEYFEEDIHSLSMVFAPILFRSENKKYDDVIFKEIVSHLDKKFADHLMGAVLIHIAKNNSNLYFHRIRKLVNKYSEYYNDFTEQDFLKFVIVSHIPNLNNGTNINRINKNAIVKTIYQKFHKLETNNDILVLLEKYYTNVSSFIFSDQGLFNKNNKYLVDSCTNIASKMFTNNYIAKNVVKSITSYLNIKKLKYIDHTIRYYSKQLDYLSFYDLTYLVENVQSLEKEYLGSFIFEEKVAATSVVLNTLNVKKQQTKSVDNKNSKNAKNFKTQDKTEKIDKEVKTKEFRNYLDKFFINITLYSNFALTRIEPLLLLTIENPMHLQNLQVIFKHMWNLLKVEHTNQTVQNIMVNLFKKNSLLNEFAYEIPSLMQMQTNPQEFDKIIEKFPGTIINFNEKLEKMLVEINDKVVLLFENFDFIFTKLLFFIILNPHISNEDKTSSVNILIKIIENLNENIINYSEISILCISLLKTSYNAQNLSTFLEIFLKRCKEDHFLTLCNDILEYEYIAKVTFLEQIISLKLVSLRKYKNLVFKIWMLIYDENDNISLLAKAIWNEFGLYVDKDFVKSDEISLAFTHHRLRDSFNRAIRAYSFIVPSECKHILQKYQNCYEKELIENDENEVTKLRTSFFDYIDETIELFNADMKKSILDFLMHISDKETDEELFESMNSTIFIIIYSIEDEHLIEDILSSIEKNIKQIMTKTVKEINTKNLMIILMMLQSILRKNNQNDLSIIKTSTSATLFDSLNTLALKLTNTEVLYLISTCYHYLAKDNKDKSSEMLQISLNKFKTDKSNIFNIGELYIMAGLVKFFGINSYKTLEVHSAVLDNMKKNKSSVEKQNAITLIRVFSDALKRAFEPYLVVLFDDACSLISDRDEKVRESTQVAIKTFMKTLSGFAVKTIMPRLIKDLHSMNWRSKIVNIEILGQFVFCAPKQLSIYIPKVIKEIMIVFQDPHEKVQETAIAVLKDISSVIKNPEIVGLSDLLIDAVANPYEHSKNALTALLETVFKHAIDPPGLALIIPIIDYNLKINNEVLKKQAAHVIGSIANLVNNPVDIYQYIDIIITSLKHALFDSIPECRNAMAKAIGSLTKKLGQSYLIEMIEWIKTFLVTESETVQKSGAAQAYAEILVAFGEAFIDKEITSIIHNIQEGDHIAREGYMSIFVFLPGCMQERFEKYFDLIFPLIIEGFSDSHENVRNVSNKIFEICIKLFAKRNTKQLIDPLLLRLFDTNWRIRNSSIALLKTLIMNLNKEFFKETSTYFTKEQREELLTNIFILKADQCGNTSTIANMIWRDYVDNIPRLISRILRAIYERIMSLLSTQDDEIFEITEGLIKMLVTKFSDKFFMELLPMIKDTITEQKDNESIVYASFYIIQIACSESSEKLLSGFKDKILKTVNENIHTPFSSIRKLLANIVSEIAHKFDEHNTNKTFLYNTMKNARNGTKDQKRDLLELVGNLVEISKDVLNLVVNEIFRKPYEEEFIGLSRMIASDIAENIRDPVELKDLYNNFYEAIQVVPQACVDAIVAITSNLDDTFLPIFLEFLDKLRFKIESGNSKIEKMEIFFSDILYKFVEISEQDLTKVKSGLFEANMVLLTIENNEILKNVGNTMKLIVEKSEDKSDVDKFIYVFLNKIHDIEEYYGHIKLDEKFKPIIDNLLFIAQTGLLYGEDKIQTTIFLQKIIDTISKQTLKSSLLKLIGPMIRVLSEKSAPEIKERILENIKSLMIKGAEDIKGISPQLQVVFLKALSDTSIPDTERLQLKAGENLLRLLQYYPRAEAVVNDLIKSVISKIEKKEIPLTIIEVEIISDIIRFYGHTIKPNVVKDQYEKILNIIKENNIELEVYTVLLSCYTKLFNTEETTKLIKEIDLGTPLQTNLFKFIAIFNGNIEFYNNYRVSALKMIKSIEKSQSVILLKAFGKIFHKYNYFKSFNPFSHEEILEGYTKIIKSIIVETDIFISSSNNIVDATVCLFLISLGYLIVYEDETIVEKIIKFILTLIEEGKVNNQLLANCLSLITTMEIKPSLDFEAMLGSMERMGVDEDSLELVQKFFKRVSYYKDSQ